MKTKALSLALLAVLGLTISPAARADWCINNDKALEEVFRTWNSGSEFLPAFKNGEGFAIEFKLDDNPDKFTLYQKGKALYKFNRDALQCNEYPCGIGTCLTLTFKPDKRFRTFTFPCEKTDKNFYHSCQLKAPPPEIMKKTYKNTSLKIKNQSIEKGKGHSDSYLCNFQEFTAIKQAWNCHNWLIPISDLQIALGQAVCVGEKSSCFHSQDNQGPFARCLVLVTPSVAEILPSMYVVTYRNNIITNVSPTDTSALDADTTLRNAVLNTPYQTSCQFRNRWNSDGTMKEGAKKVF